MICTSCGKSLADNSGHCPFCGSCILGKDYSEEQRTYNRSYKKYNKDENSGYIRSYNNYNRRLGNRYSKDGSTASPDKDNDYVRVDNLSVNSYGKNNANEIFDLNSYSRAAISNKSSNEISQAAQIHSQPAVAYSNHAKAAQSVDNTKAIKTFLLVAGIVIAFIFFVIIGNLNSTDYILTTDNYSKIRTGMSKNEVTAILGEPSSKSKTYHNNYDYSTYTLDTYVWREGNAYVEVVFRDGSVTRKTSSNLYSG